MRRQAEVQRTVESDPGVADALAPPAGNPRFPLLDALRGVAALAVVLFHAAQLTSHADDFPGRLLAHLDVGVTVFFLLTGFLLYRPFVASAILGAPRMPTRVFYWRRFLRIAPGYWVALLVLSPILAFATLGGLPNAAFLQIYDPDWTRTGIPPAWSVCVEVSFYLLLPLYANLADHLWRALDPPQRRRRELVVLALLGACSLVFRTLLLSTDVTPYAVDVLPGTFAWFAVGMALAVISVTPGPRGQRLVTLAQRRGGWLWLAAAVTYALTLLTAQGGVEGPTPLFVTYGLIAALVLTPAVFARPGAGSVPSVVLRRPELAWLGLVSYGVYLYHFPLIREISGSGSLAVAAGGGAALAVLAGALSYYLVERHALRLKRWHRVTKRTRPRATL